MEKNTAGRSRGEGGRRAPEARASVRGEEGPEGGWGVNCAQTRRGLRLRVTSAITVLSPPPVQGGPRGQNHRQSNTKMLSAFSNYVDICSGE